MCCGRWHDGHLRWTGCTGKSDGRIGTSVGRSSGTSYRDITAPSLEVTDIRRETELVYFARERFFEGSEVAVWDA